MADWTEGDCAILKRLWADGRSAKEISQVLDCKFSRDAVLGRIRRMNLNRQGPRAQEPTQTSAPLGWECSELPPEARFWGWDARFKRDQIYRQARRGASEALKAFEAAA